ncbi:hypothetical protein G7070_08370 [Propioniciclava coleopterorum]|uniref:Uncharacterized protein n=1 Tax=Propioniciclava coleopterorum TaxID=2714937 RepID=A0A6G7Y6D7_9ACTN|nr:hypothetical protein [Propioniciclava coleopterorum]QIK72279.1 hypothetical protein G7070_08370 [Propioniciclava coleopterorum]
MAEVLVVGTLTEFYAEDLRERDGSTPRLMPAGEPGAGPAPDAAVADQPPEEVVAAVRRWQVGLCTQLGVRLWDEAAGVRGDRLKPGECGVEAVHLLAAYLERPELDPRRRGLPADAPGTRAAAVAVASAYPHRQRFPTLLGGVPVWLPVPGPTVFQLVGPDGRMMRFGSLASLRREVDDLVAAAGLRPDDLADALAHDPPPRDADLDEAGRHGLAAFAEMIGRAEQRRLPLWRAHRTPPPLA